MYKLFLIYDQKEPSRIISSTIDWSNYDIELCGESTDIDTAFEKLSLILPDIIIIDITILKNLALTLLNKISNSTVNSKCIVLSYYDDLSFVQKVMELDIFSYILKPCADFNIITQVLFAKNIILKETFNISSLNTPINFKNIDKNSNINILIHSALIYIGTNYNKNITLESVANEILITPVYLSKLFKQETNMNFLEYIHRYRIEQSKDYLKNSFLKIYEVSSLVGYSHEKYFSKTFKKYVGQNPKKYRQAFRDHLLINEIPILK
jgi:two-component system response regulator YesN